jgi:hypothetical protein
VLAPVASPDALTPAQREYLRKLADAWIPAGSGMPAASDVGVTEAQLDQVLAARPDLVAPLCGGLSQDGAPPDEVVDLLRYVVAAAYYLSPEVRRAMSYDPEHVVPVSARAYPEYVAEGLLDHMLETEG